MKKGRKIKIDVQITKSSKAITLITLIITIILLIILAGIIINLSLGENGLISKVKYSKTEYEKAQLKEELELEIINLQTEKVEQLTFKDISERFESKGISVNIEKNDGIEGEYKNYEFIVDENKKVIIGEKLKGEKPKIVTGTAIDITDGKMRIQIIAKEDVISIEPINGGTLVSENGNNKIFEVPESGNYKFKIVGTNGRVTIAEVKVNNELEIVEGFSLLEGVSKVNSSGIKNIKIIEKSNEYSINTIVYEGNMILDGRTPLVGSKLNNKIYEFGSENDVATQNAEAKNMVVLKVNGNLTIDEGVTLTACKSNNNYGGPKGMLIYCTGTFNNNGTTSMTARGAKAKGEDVYLWKNTDGSFEYIPSIGALGGEKTPGPYSSNSWAYAAGKTGENGSSRMTGGGGSGGSDIKTSGTTGSQSGRGGNGTSYSGGTGGGAADRWGSGGCYGSGRCRWLRYRRSCGNRPWK